MGHDKHWRLPIPFPICHTSATRGGGSFPSSAALWIGEFIVSGDQFFVDRQPIDTPLHKLGPAHSGLLHQFFYEPGMYRSQLDVEIHRFGHKWMLCATLGADRGGLMVDSWVINRVSSHESATSVLPCFCTIVPISPEVTKVQARLDLASLSEKLIQGIPLNAVLGGIVFALGSIQRYGSLSITTEKPHDSTCFSLAPYPCRTRHHRRSQEGSRRSICQHSHADLPISGHLSGAADWTIGQRGPAAKSGPHA